MRARDTNMQRFIVFAHKSSQNTHAQKKQIGKTLNTQLLEFIVLLDYIPTIFSTKR